MSTRNSLIRKLALVAAVPLTLSAVLMAPAAQAAQGTGVSAVQPAKSYTLSQVKKHNKATDCWTVVGKNVYNLTGWIKKHPGGSGAIVGMCGKNATKAFSAQHGSGGAAGRALSSYKIGTLA